MKVWCNSCPKWIEVELDWNYCPYCSKEIKFDSININRSKDSGCPTWWDDNDYPDFD